MKHFIVVVILAIAALFVRSQGELSANEMQGSAAVRPQITAAGLTKGLNRIVLQIGTADSLIWVEGTGTNPDTLEFPPGSSWTTETIQDLVGDMVDDPTETNITVTYDDENGNLEFVVTDAWWNALGDIALTSANIIVGNGSNVAAAVAMSGDVTIDNTGATTVANNSHTHDSTTVSLIGVEDVSTNLEAHWWNAWGDAALSSAQIVVGNGSNVAAGVAMSGDVTIDNTGATTVGDNSHAHDSTSISLIGVEDVSTNLEAHWWNADGDIDADEISESKINFSTKTIFYYPSYGATPKARGLTASSDYNDLYVKTDFCTTLSNIDYKGALVWSLQTAAGVESIYVQDIFEVPHDFASWNADSAFTCWGICGTNSADSCHMRARLYESGNGTVVKEFSQSNATSITGFNAASSDMGTWAANGRGLVVWALASRGGYANYSAGLNYRIRYAR